MTASRLHSLAPVVTEYTPAERRRWCDRVRTLLTFGTALGRALQLADLAHELDQAADRAGIDRGHVLPRSFIA